MVCYNNLAFDSRYFARAYVRFARKISGCRLKSGGRL